MSDLILIKLMLSSKEIFERYSPFIRLPALSKETQLILSDLKVFYESFPGEKAELSEFTTWFHQVKNPELDQVKHQLYQELWKRVSEQELEDNKEFVEGIIAHFKEEDFKSRLLKHLEESKNFDVDTLTAILEQYQKESSEAEEITYDVLDFEKIDQETDRSGGLKWRINFLNNKLGAIMIGDFILVAAYVNTGKSAFVYSEATYMAQQLTEGSVLIFNNEQKQSKIHKRCISAALKLPWCEIRKDFGKYIAQYKEVMHGEFDRIKYYWALGWTPAQILREAKKHNAKLIIIDMMSKLKFGKGDDAEHLRVGRLGAELRQIANTVCPIIGTSQCDASVTWKDRDTGEEMFQKYIGMAQLRQSKVDLQGEAEVLITIGKDSYHPKTRYLNIAKTKEGGDESKTEVLFDEDRSLYEDF